MSHCPIPTSNVRETAKETRHRITLNAKDNKPAIFNLAGHPTADAKDVYVEIVWQNPKQSLTLVIVTPHTKQREAFSVSFDYPPQGSMSNIYHIVDGEEKAMPMNASFFKIQSDKDYHVVVKLVPTSNTSDDVLFGYFFDRL